MKLAILGNGFDLHHGLNTSFDNFREWCIKDEGKKEFINKIDTIIKNGEKDSTIISWAEFEGEFQNLYLIFKELRLFNINSFEGDIWFSPYKGLKINSYTFWDGKEKESLENIEEYFIEDKLLSREGEVKLSKLIKLLEGSLEELSNNFSIYFDEYMKEQIIPKVNNLKKYKQIQDILSEVDYIITFNYTNVHKIHVL